MQAIATMIANAAMAFRPVVDGKPVPPSVNAYSLLQHIFVFAMEQTRIHEQGLQDFVIPFQRSEAGGIEVKTFDFSELMKGKP